MDDKKQGQEKQKKKQQQQNKKYYCLFRYNEEFIIAEFISKNKFFPIAFSGIDIFKIKVEDMMHYVFYPPILCSYNKKYLEKKLDIIKLLG